MYPPVRDQGLLQRIRVLGILHPLERNDVLRGVGFVYRVGRDELLVVEGAVAQVQANELGQVAGAGMNRARRLWILKAVAGDGGNLVVGALAMWGRMVGMFPRLVRGEGNVVHAQRRAN